MAGAWWVGGFTGHGMGYGFQMGRTVAAALLGETDPLGDLFRTHIPAGNENVSGRF